MEEKILKNKKNGLSMLLLFLVLYLAGIIAVILGAFCAEKGMGQIAPRAGTILLIIGIAYLALDGSPLWVLR